MIEEKEKEIDIKDMLVKILSKWKWMVLVGIIGALALAALRFTKDTVEISRSEDKEALLASIEGDMTSEQLNNSATYLALYDRLTALRSERETRPYYQMDPYHENKLTLIYEVKLPDVDVKDQVKAEYLIAEHLNDELKVDRITALYREHVGTEDFLGMLVDVSGLTETGLRDLVTTSVLDSLVYVNVVYNEDMDISAISEAIKADLEQYYETISVDDEHELILVDESHREIIDSSLVNILNDLASREYSLQNQVNSFYNSLDDVSKSYVDVYKQIQEGINVDEQEEVVVVKESVSPKSVIKFGIVGCVLGVFLVCAWELMRYILSGKLHTVEEISDYYGLQVFGVQTDASAETDKADSDEKKSTRGRHRVFSGAEEKEIILSSIELYCKQHDITEIVFTGSDVEHVDEAYLKSLIDALKGQGIKAAVQKNIYYYPKALQEAAQVSHVVLVETLEASIDREIENVLTKAGEFNIQIIGAVVLA